MNKVEKIRAEIKRLKQSNKALVEDCPYYDGLTDALDEILSFIDSLEEEPVSNDLEEACDEYYDETWDEHGGKAMVVDGCHDIWFPSQATDDFFKAGAQWQKKQTIDKACGS